MIDIKATVVTKLNDIPKTHEYYVITGTYEDTVKVFQAKHPTYTPPTIYRFKNETYFTINFKRSFGNNPLTS